MNAHDFFHGNSQQAEGIVVADVVLRGTGYVLNVGQGFDFAARRNARLAQALMVEGNVVVAVIHHPAQLAQLQVLNILSGHGFNFFLIEQFCTPKIKQNVPGQIPRTRCLNKLRNFFLFYRILPLIASRFGGFLSVSHKEKQREFMGNMDISGAESSSSKNNGLSALPMGMRGAWAL